MVSTANRRECSSPFPLPSSLDERSEVAVLIPAAGEGARMGGQRKQFRRLGGAPVLVQTLRVFEQHPDVQYLVVGAPVGEVEAVEEVLYPAGLNKRVVVVPGGDTRQASVASALDAAPETVEIALVHDAVRPFVASGLISAVIEAVRTHGAAAPAVRMADTLRRGADGRFGETMPRRGLYRMQTPQGFRRSWLAAAHAEAARTGFHATDDVDLVQRLGHAVYLVEGSTRNFKITTPEDWELAQALWQVRRSEFGVPSSETPNPEPRTPNE